MTKLRGLYYCAGGRNSIILSLSIAALFFPSAKLHAADRAKFHPPLPSAVVEPTKKFTGTLFAYSSTHDQTNGNPFITASGNHVADGVVAANCLPFGTRLRIPTVFGDKVFIVQDRLAAWHNCSSIDIWFPTRTDAIRFGKRRAEVIVLPSSNPRLLIHMAENKPAYQYSTP